jgi:hypothetical protein
MPPAIGLQRSVLEFPAAPAVAAPGDSRRWGFLEWFILAQLMLPALLFLPGTQPLRVPIRMAPFALGLGGFAMMLGVRRRVIRHPATTTLTLIVVYLLAMIPAPGTNSPLSGLAQVMLYVSVMAPVFWAPALVMSYRQVRRIIVILLICNGINAAAGVLQVRYPQTFMPRELSTLVTESQAGAATYIGPNGEQIVRPPGLSDNPGAVCSPASIAALLGVILATRPIGWPARFGALALGFAGIAAIFLSHVRTSFIILVGTYVVYLALLVIKGDRRNAIMLGCAAAGLLAAALAFAALIGGESVVDRFATLVEADPTTVYYNSSRGAMLQYDTQEYLSAYPLGAGLGRWGMMRSYFGDESNPDSPPLWAEVQYPAWALDGGFVLLLLYSAVLLRNTWHEFAICRRLHRTSLAYLATMIFACNVGALGLTLGFTPFTTQIVLQYWFLAGVLHGIAKLPHKEPA